MKVFFLVGVLSAGLFFAAAIASEIGENEENAKQLVLEAINEATGQYDEMMRQATIFGAQSTRHTREAKKSTKLTQEIGRISSIYRKAFKQLTSRNRMNSELALKLLYEALPQQCRAPTLNCNASAKYRTVDGTCNNLENPLWGSVGRASKRLLTPAYNDSIEEPRGGKDGSGLPPSRTVSAAVHIGNGLSFESKVTHMAAQFGQFLDHDITLTPVNGGSCCPNSTLEECWAMPVDVNDAHYGKNNITCLDFVRSTETCFPAPGVVHREQFNDITAYIDGSVVYGSDDEKFKNLRKGKEGKLAENAKHPGFLPWASEVVVGGQDGAVIAGDVRANEMPGLTVMHSLFLREHNSIAEELGKLRKDWNDEKIFQETRRIIAAELQQITYGEFLPVILGEKAMKDYDLELPKEHTSYSNYNASVDATIFNNFATAAYRFGHTLVNGLIKLFLDDKEVGQYHVRENYLISDQIINNTIQGATGYDLILNGLIRQASQAYDAEIHTDMTNHLFKTINFIGTDLAARNIQRGRDHGIPSYNEFRKFCRLSSLTTWTAKPADISNESWLKLRTAGYKSPQDIDLYTGGLSEVPVAGALSGPTFVCLQAFQFEKLMKGDRFFFTHGNVSGSFSQEQLAALRRRTLGDIICQNSKIKEAPKNVFYIKSTANPMMTCDSDSRKLNYKLFAELTSGATDLATANLATLFASLLCSFTVILRIF